MDPDPDPDLDHADTPWVPDSVACAHAQQACTPERACMGHPQGAECSGADAHGGSGMVFSVGLMRTVGEWRDHAHGGWVEGLMRTVDGWRA